MSTDIPEMDLSTAEAIARQVVAAKGEGASWRVVGPLLRELAAMRAVRLAARRDLLKVERNLRAVVQRGARADGLPAMADVVERVRRAL